MENITVYNFTKLQELKIGSSVNEDPRIGALVNITAHSGALTMYFSMRPNQARYLAEALIKHAEHLDDTERA